MAISNPVASPGGYQIMQSGSATINSGTTFVNVSLSMPDANYTVLTEVVGLGLTIFISNKTASSFRINCTSAPGSNTTVNWVAIKF
jgi:hypothetical protein